jgi:CDGSH-type Zn-finger protein
MTEPKIAQKSPYVIDEEVGKKFWCACGASQKQPYCDGSHKGTGITPVALEIESSRKVAWCGCKQTQTPPFCDGSHRDL